MFFGGLQIYDSQTKPIIRYSFYLKYLYSSGQKNLFEI